MKSIKFLLPLVISIFVGCAQQRKLSRDEWISATQRSYSNISAETLISKAQEVLVLADGDDFNFSHSNRGFSASRNWTTYFVIGAAMGTDFWTFEVEPQGKDILLAKISVSTVAGNLVAAGGGSTLTTPGHGSPAQGNVVYNIFWNRLDYLLGKTDQWMDCKLVSKKIFNKEFFGNDEALCNSFNLTNEYPLNLSDSEVDRIFASTGPNGTGSRKKDYLEKRSKKLND